MKKLMGVMNEDACRGVAVTLDPANGSVRLYRGEALDKTEIPKDGFVRHAAANLDGAFEVDPYMVLETFQKRVHVLEARATEYLRLLTIVEVMVEEDVPSGDTVIRVRPQDSVKGKSWREILELAVRRIDS